MTIGLFFGSFNPIHTGHLSLSNWICEEGYVEEMWFVISPHNPLKNKEGLAEENLRLEWTRTAIQGYDKFKATDIEFSMKRPSYTIDTLHTLSSLYPEHNFQLVLGADNWLSFPQWKNPEQILKEYNLLLYPRRGSRIGELPSNVHYLPAPLIEISSTFLRDAFQRGKEYPFLLPQSIYASVRKYYAYKEGK